MIEKKTQQTSANKDTAKKETFYLFSRLGFLFIKYIAIALSAILFYVLLVNILIKPRFVMNELFSIVCYNVIPAIFTVILFMSLFGRKIRYINEIQKGIQIIEGGSTDYIIPIRGSDELSDLAESINKMRQAMNEQFRSESQSKKENHRLITSVSHDIRTPLTSIICYLELINDNKVNDPVKESLYLNTALKKSYQIKDLMNSLFEHALAENNEVPFHFEIVNGNVLISQVIEELSFSLNEEGFQLVLVNHINQDFTLNIDLKQIRRIFDNLISNILKYANPKEPVNLEFIIKKNELSIIQHNKTKTNSKNSCSLLIDSSGIGLATCRGIILRHQGRIDSYLLHYLFKIELSLPIQSIKK